MELYIQIRNGQPFEHPIFADNFRQAFPHVDTNNLPPEFAKFVRVACPNNAGTYEVDDVTYQWVNGVVTDVWSVRPMTQEERVEKDNTEKDRLLQRVEMMKGVAAQDLSSATTDAARQAWTDYMLALNAWVYVDWKQPNLPVMPRFDENGNLLSLNAAGGAPNVID